MATYKPSNLAENRAIHASGERGVDVAPFGSMRPLKPAGLRAPGGMGKVPGIKVPKAQGAVKKRRYYGE